MSTNCVDMSVSSATIDDVQNGLDAYFAYLNNEWASPLFMDMHVGFDCHQRLATAKTDVNQFIGNPIRSFSLGEHAYFSREKYPIPSLSANKSKAYDGFQTLYHDLICAARESGFELVQKGRVPPSQLSKVQKSHWYGQSL